MDAHKAVQWVFGAVVVMGLEGSCCQLCADSMYTYGGEFSLRIPADPAASKGWMNDAIIDVPEHITINDLDVGLSITHPSAFDLQISLVNPAGTCVYLNYYDFIDFFKGANYTQTIFDDEAALGIEEGSVPFTGRFRPKAGNKLEAFDGQDAFGLWRLKIYDFWHSDSGTLDRFEINITTPEPAGAILVLLGTAFMTLLRRR